MILRSADEITPSWVSDCLRAAGALRGKVIDCEVTPVDDFGIMSDLLRVSLTYSNPSQSSPETLIVKLPSSDAKTREIGRGGRFYEREVRFYTELAPEGALPVPTSYHADFDPDSGDFVLLLEDLGVFRHGDQENEVGPARIEAALSHLARLHARWWESPTLADADWLLRWPDEESAAGAAGAFEASWAALVDRSEFPIPSWLQDNGAEIGKWMPRIAAEMSGPPRTLLHGDLHPPNVYFDDTNSEREVIAVDWQLAAHGRSTFDIACVLTTWLRPETRRQRWEKLLTGYQAQLIDLGIRTYSLKDCLRDYKLSVLFLFINTVFTRVSFLPQNDRDRRVMGEAWDRITTSAIDVLSE